jgi:hypothetical protein
MSGQKMRPEFNRLHALTLNPATSMDALAAGLQAAEAVQDRHRLSEGAVYASACRRWLLETGADWRTTQQPDGAATWGGQSDHRLRVRPAEGGVVWGCSCGATGAAVDDSAATAAHAEHTTTERTVA